MALWRQEWRAASTRIERLLAAGDFFIRFQLIHAADPKHAAATELLPTAKRIFEHLKDFRVRNSLALPPKAVEALDSFFARSERDFTEDIAPGAATVKDMTLIRLMRLSSIRSELEYHFSDQSAIGRRLSERAFLHLQRSIVADSEVRRRWQEAFNAGEGACEKLGASHLLLHGIWAFKAYSEGERTDLVFPDIPLNVEEVERSAEALVLTEWKVVNSKSDLLAKAKDAYKQASRYGAGSLAGLELVQYRYLVMVSANFLTMPDPVDASDARYEYVNIAVEPKTPSRS